jgi:excisionase family DNA binding protein
MLMPTASNLHEAEAIPDDDLLTRSGVARLLCVSPTTVTRWAREGRIACRVTLGGHHRFERSVVEGIRARMFQGEVADTPAGGRGRS